MERINALRYHACTTKESTLSTVSDLLLLLVESPPQDKVLPLFKKKIKRILSYFSCQREIQGEDSNLHRITIISNSILQSCLRRLQPFILICLQPFIKSSRMSGLCLTLFANMSV